VHHLLARRHDEQAVTRARPRIGITATTGGSTSANSRRYADAVAAAGGEPVWLEPAAVLGAPDPGSVLARLDALLLSGGEDIDPRHYAETIRPDAGVTIDAPRDTAELRIARAALAEAMPILGICRGIQTLNVAAGGTLHQDLTLLGLTPDAHVQDRSTPAWKPAHPVAVERGSQVAAHLGGPAAEVNSFHHQAVKDVAPGFVVTARAPDGIIETIEHPARPFVMGVQWHPERMVDHHPGQRKLFEALVAAARHRK